MDEPPSKQDYSKSIAYTGHTENATGTDARYVPYNTTRAKIQEFDLKKGTFKSIADRILDVDKFINKK